MPLTFILPPLLWLKVGLLLPGYIRLFSPWAASHCLQAENLKGMPCAQAKKPRGLEKWFNVLLIVFYGIAGILAAIGSVHNIIKHADEYHSFG